MNTTFRQATFHDSYTVFKIFEEAVADLGRRFGTQMISGGRDPNVLNKLWEDRRSLFEHLAQTSEHFWLAENDGQAIGYARTVLRDGLRELTEIFVSPNCQSAGVGTGLLARAFPREGATHRVIIASLDSRALALYLKAGVYPRFPSIYFSRSPRQMTSLKTDLTFKSISKESENIDILGELDMALLGHRRDIDHKWLLENRRGYFYCRDNQKVGYGYVGKSSGPFALLNDIDFPAVLTHAEMEAAAYSGNFGAEVPLINQAVVRHLLSQGFQMEGIINLVMSDTPFGKFENYVFPSPPFFL